jgi:hypothetical protein
VMCVRIEGKSQPNINVGKIVHPHPGFRRFACQSSLLFPVDLSESTEPVFGSRLTASATVALPHNVLSQACLREELCPYQGQPRRPEFSRIFPYFYCCP